MAFRSKFATALLALLSFVAFAPLSAQAQDPAPAQNPRIALIIGDSAYPDHPLATPANDAGLVAQTLQAAGFEVVGARDLDQNALRGALRDFLDKAATIGPNMQAFVYLSGRGVQYDGDNYFLPIDARIARDADIPIQAIKISDFSHALAATPGRARILVLDAARPNGFAAEGSALAGGLGLVDPEDGTLMAFNAAPGTVAPDEPGPYGVYGKALAGAMRAGGLPIDDVFAQTRLQVNQQTHGALVPWSVSKIEEPYSIFERAPDAPPPPAIAAAAESAKRPLNSFGPDEGYSIALQRDTLAGYQQYLAAYPDSPQARRVRAILAARREAIFWRRSVNQNSPRAYWTYLRVYPKGPHVGDAQRRLQILSAQFAPPADFAPLDYSDLPPPPPDESVYDNGPAFVFDGPDYGPPPPPPPYAFLPEQDDDWRDLPPPPPPAGAGFLPVLPMAIPLLLGAKVLHDHGAAHAQQAPGAPPPLPQGFKPRDHAPATPGVAPLAQPLNAGKAAPVVPLAPGVAPAVQPRPGAGKPPLNSAEPLVAKPPAPAVTGPSPSKPELKAAPIESKPASQPVRPAPPIVRPQQPAFKPAPAEHAAPPAPHVAPPVERVAPPPPPHAAPPPPAPHAAPPPPAPHAAPPPPAPHAAPPPPAPHAAPPPPAPHAAPPPPPPHAAPPPPAPHAAPPPPHAAPPPGKRPACGLPNTPPCPK